MLGAFRKTMVGGATMGLIALALAYVPTPANALDQNSVCAVVTQPAEVYNVEYGETGTGHDNQPKMGTWVNSSGQTVNRYGLYYPATDPAKDHAVPRLQNFGRTDSVPHTPVQVGDDFKFRQEGKCNGEHLPGAKFKTAGNAIGYCGRSVGLGTGTVTLNGQTVSTIIRWESVASQLILLDPSARGSVNAQPTPTDPSKGSCSNGTAITFLVDGVLADMRPLP